MKKTLASILAVLYLSTSTGATLHFHYCMGRLISWGFRDDGTNTCRYCGMEKYVSDEAGNLSSNHCCADQHKHLSAGNDQRMVPFTSLISKLSLDLAASPSAYDEPGFQGLDISSNPKTHAPPRISPIPAFLLNRNLRI